MDGNFEENRSYRLVDIFSGRGLGYEVYSNYDYLIETSGEGSTFNFESVRYELLGNRFYKIRVNGGNWGGYNYLTLADSGWVYLDTKENATVWHTQRIGVDLAKFQFSQGGIEKGRYLGYIQQGNKKWLAATDYGNAKSFKLV
ncbi:hypothetical protein GFV16_11350 [Bacillus megaterium]|uniref:hypothetical protein n=1 Tax=Priestia megaterium TaxID=1404 RepID=UPI00129364F8|nr:hypothetical protein [Priestia megaterium]MQR86507.1 hypothetical protein [Priestia megaterium]